MKLVCFPCAGGSSALYAPWLHHPALCAAFSSVMCAEYPVCAGWSDQEPIGHIDPLVVDSILEHNKCFNDTECDEEIVLFGHSFGAIVAFEVARRLEKKGRPPKAVYVSACVPPSKSPLVESSVSHLSADEICDFFVSKGHPVSKKVLPNARMDHTCPETYLAEVMKGSGGRHSSVLSSLRNSMRLSSLRGVCDEDAQDNEDARDPSVVFITIIEVHPDKGHFDEKTLADLGDFIVTSVKEIQGEGIGGNIKPSEEARDDVTIPLYLFPFAGGTSLSYKSLERSILARLGDTHVKLDCRPIDLPGRLLNPSGTDEEIIYDIPMLAGEVAKMIFDSDDGKAPNGPYALFGHSFGAILAFEITKKVEQLGMQPPMTIFVSACRAPSSPSLTSSEGSTPVSMMEMDEIQEYLKACGSDVVLDTNDLSDDVIGLVVDAIRADYKGLESYVANYDKVMCPVTLIGGDDDPIVSVDQLIAWKDHCSECKTHILEGQGHFYVSSKNDLNDTSTKIAGIVVDAIEVAMGGVGDEKNTLAAIKGSVADIFAAVLNVNKEDIGPESDFFELGGSSLDTIALISRIEAAVGVHVTQNEFFLNPRAGELAQRIVQLKASSMEFPKLAAALHSNEPKWFPASNSQEQMIWCWESNPCMYNMSTTIHFTGEAVDVGMMKTAMKFVVEQQPTLRTIVAIQEGNKFMQKVLPVAEADSCFELKVIHDTHSVDEVAQIVKKENQYVFPLYDPPIVRAVVIRTSQGDFLYLSQYHVGSDSWSLVVLRRQLLEAYKSIRSSGHVSNTLGTAPHPNFIDWTMWNHRCLHDYGIEEQQLGYWKRKLKALPVLTLPLDKPRPQSLGSSGLQIPIDVSPEIANAFKSVMSSHGTNMYAGLLACYMITLYRMGGGDDFAVGIALANRNSEGLHDLIGYFANEATVRVLFPEGVKFAEILGQVRENILEAMANADVAFHDVVKALNVPRDSSRTPVFQAFFALQERKWWTLDDICPPKGDDLQFHLANFNSHISKFEVHMFIRDNESGGIEGELTISTDLFNESTGHRLADMFLSLVERIATTAQDRPVLSYDITPASDKHIAQTANDTHVDFDPPVPSFLNWDIKSDDLTVAIICHNPDGNTAISYSELNRRVKAVHSYLADECRLVGREPVGLLIRSSADAIAAIYGSVSNGCPVVIVDPEKTPCDRARSIFKDAGATVLVVGSGFEHDFSSLKRDFDFRLLDEVVNHVYASPPEAKKMSKEDHFGYFYTSGTTGMPKGAIITHGNVLNLVQWWMKFFSLTNEDRVLLFSSLSFIMSLRQYLPTLCAGGTIVLPQSSVDFESAIVHGGVNKLVCTPSALGVLDVPKVAPNIDAVQVAGEPPRLSTMVAWKERVPKVFIGLGPTELTAHALCGEFDGETICIGYPAANVKARIMCSGGHSEAPINVAGELWISGANVSNGYLNRPELTSEHFSLDAKSGLRCYKTGDLAKRLPDGRIQFIGREDTQLKVNGFRLEAAEIINALPKELKQAHVMVQSQGVLVLYKTKEVPANDIKKHLEATLPSYMVPKSYFQIDAFPLNKNRKIDVPKLVSDSILEACHAEAEHNSLEKDENIIRMENTVRLEWAQSLKIPVNTIHSSSNFFEIGGTSLTTVLVARGLKERLGREIPVQDLFLHQELNSLASHLCKDGNETHFVDTRPLQYLPRGRKVLPSLLWNILQGFGLFLMSMIIFLPVIGTVVVSARSIAWFGMIGGAFIPAILASGCFAHLLLVFACKWILIGRFREGKAKVFSLFFLKWWLLRRIMNSTRLYTWAFDDTILACYFLRLLGAGVGHNVSIENVFMLEPDLVSIGEHTVVEFECYLNTSEVRNGVLELRSIEIGKNVKLGARSVILGGSRVHDDSEVAPKSVVDYSSSTQQPMQYLIGSPAKIQPKELNGSRWKPQLGTGYLISQIMCSMIFPGLLAACLYAGALPGFIVEKKFGVYGLFLYMVTAFSYTAGLAFLAIILVMKKALMPRLEEDRLYSGHWFMLRHWFLDRLFLSPAFAFSLQRSLEVTSSYPLYLRLLGANLGRKVWLSYITLRVGLESVQIEDGVHTGMATYITTTQTSSDGIIFNKVNIGKYSSCGQRSIISSGSHIGMNVTIGAETAVLPNAFVHDNGTVFGSPPVTLYSSRTNEEIVDESQKMATKLNRNGSMIDVDIEEGSLQPEEEPSLQQNRRLPFWLYGVVMNLAQFCLPALVIAPFVVVFILFRLVIGFDHVVIWVVALVPATFLLGCIILMLVIKLIQLGFFGGSQTSGTITYYSVPFMKWYFLSDLIYFCTSTIFVPFSGTEIFNIFLRLMGSDIGERVFFSPENGGLREMDFLTVRDGCHILTPNLNSHYADHQIMQFAKVVFAEGCEINPGATIMPLTEYGKGCTLRPFSVTSKGQTLEPHKTYMGYPCKAVQDHSANATAVLFAGLGSTYPGMLKNIESFPEALAVLNKAEGILSLDIRGLCGADTDPTNLESPETAQLLVTVMNLLSVEVMRQCHALLMSQVSVVAGFSVGEFAALHFSGAISFEDTLNLVRVQCEAFSEMKHGTTLCNIRGLSRKDVQRACRLFCCSIANVICDHSNQSSKNVFVCGGMRSDIEQLVEHINNIAKTRAACDSGLNMAETGQRSEVSAKQLRVGTANHTSFMNPAVKRFREALARTSIILPRDFVVYSNVTGKPYTSAEEIRRNLVLQMTRPVQWHSVITSVHLDEQCTQFLECGGMKSLSTMTKLILDDSLDELKLFSSDATMNDGV